MKVVVKVGGTLLEADQDRMRIARQVVRQVRAGHRVLLIHGGGKQLTQYLERTGIESRFRDGLRITNAETLDGVVKVFGGTVNHALLAAFVRAGLPAVGLSGIDASGLVAEKLRSADGQDWGFVGRVIDANPAVWELLSQAGYLPVLACLAVGEDGQIYNVNADRAAVACTVYWGADRLIFLTDVDGVRDGEGRAVARLAEDEIPGLIASGAVTGGMLAKLSAIQEALAHQVRGVCIANGRRENVLDDILGGETNHSEPGRESVAGTIILAAAVATASTSGNRTRS